MIRKLIAIAAAIAINCAVLAWFHAWSAGVVASAAAAAPQRPVATLPVVNVHPTAEQLRELHAARAASAQSRAAVAPAPVAMRGV